MKKKFLVIANWMQGSGLSGGDRIFIELCRRFASQMDISIILSKEGYVICKRMSLSAAAYQIWPSDIFNKFGNFINYAYRTILSVLKALFFDTRATQIVYSSSDFLPDVLPAFIFKLRNENIRWIAGFYLFAPGPCLKDSPYRGRKWFVGFFYWFTQRFSYWVVNTYADIVFVTSQPDVKKFITKKRSLNNIIIIRGGVDMEPSQGYLTSKNFIPIADRKFHACFIGRFHYQKGVLEMINIWSRVCKTMPHAKLAMIGDGPLEAEAHMQIKKKHLENNIELLGFKDGEEKYAIFKNSRIVVHPATYDSGGMAAAEAMAWGLPGVSFDLEALKTYYPKGMLKTRCFDLDDFSNNILKLLMDAVFYDQESKQAIDLIKNEWDWNKRASLIYNKIMDLA